MIEADGGAGAARPCDCRLRGSLPRLLAEANIPPRYQHCTFSNFKEHGPDPRSRDCLLQAKAVSRRYVENFLAEGGGFRESGLLFIGRPGVGKTHLAVAVLGELIRQYRVRGLFADFTSLIHEIQSTFDPGSAESKHDILDPVIEAEVLVLDELGAQKPTAWVTDILYLILNRRYTRRRPTLFTTNYRLESPGTGPALDVLDRTPSPRSPELLTTRIPEMLISRLYEMAQPVLIEASDFRREVKLAELRSDLV